MPASVSAVFGKCVLLFAGAFLGIVLCETLVRLVHGERFGPRPVFYDTDPDLGWKPGSNLANRFFGPDYSLDIVTDDDGRRLGRLGAPGGHPLVVLLGDSYTFGWGVSTGDTFASQLDEALAGSSPPRRVVNLGVGGYGTLASATRLERFLQQGLNDRPELVVIIHAHNDMADNVEYALFRDGFKEASINPSAHARSVFHIINFGRHLVRTGPDRGHSKQEARGLEAKRQREADGTQDILFHFPLRRTLKHHGHIRVGSKTVAFRDLALENESRAATMRAKRLTALQRMLFEESFEKIHCASDRPLAVLHMVVHFAPRWYFDEIASLVNDSRKCRARVYFADGTPLIGENAFNRHAGGHFTPETNQRYAKFLQREVDRVIAAEDSGKPAGN